tara:strand:- start:825 stop:1316 length:492 start_codon:yes stop_codon:yes gene_type:complete
MISEQEDIFKFWFKGNKFRKEWFSENKEFDVLVKEKYSNILKLVESGRLKNWENDKTGILCLILITDQFSRHIYRNTDKFYSNNDIALNYSKNLIDNNWDKELSISKRIFALMPLRHSNIKENIDIVLKKIEEYKLDINGDSDAEDLLRRFERATVRQLRTTT